MWKRESEMQEFRKAWFRCKSFNMLFSEKLLHFKQIGSCSEGAGLCYAFLHLVSIQSVALSIEGFFVLFCFF